METGGRGREEEGRKRKRKRKGKREGEEEGGGGGEQHPPRVLARWSRRAAAMPTPPPSSLPLSLYTPPPIPLISPPAAPRQPRGLRRGQERGEIEREQCCACRAVCCHARPSRAAIYAPMPLRRWRHDGSADGPTLVARRSVRCVRVYACC